MIPLRACVIAIFTASGALGGSIADVARANAPAYEAPRATINAPHEITGILVAISGSVLSLRTRAGKIVQVDDSDAVRHQQSAVLVVGRAFDVRGTFDAAGVLHAAAIVRAKPTTWTPDHR